jgi:hypothetical protein
VGDLDFSEGALPMPPTERRTASRFRRLPLLVVLAAGLGAGAACSGSGSGGDGVASVKTAADTKSGNDAKDTKSTKAPEDAFLDYARCMREHGIDMPDPDTTGGPGIVKFGAVASSADGGSSADMSNPGLSKFEDADKACRDLLGDVGPQTMDPKQQQEMQDQALAFSRCMREHGIDMPDPTFSGQGAVTMKLDNTFDPNDAKFSDAQQACGSAFGPKGADGGPSLSVGGGKVDGGEKGGAGFMIGRSAGSTTGGGQ